jgi:hypothetical protein
MRRWRRAACSPLRFDRRRAQPARSSLARTLQRRVEPSLESTGVEPLSQRGSDSSSQEKEPLASRVGALPSSQIASADPDWPLDPTLQRRVEPSLESTGVEPFSHPGSDSSSQEKEPLASRVGALPSSQIAGIGLVPAGGFVLSAAAGFFPSACLAVGTACLAWCTLAFTRAWDFLLLPCDLNVCFDCAHAWAPRLEWVVEEDVQTALRAWAIVCAGGAISTATTIERIRAMAAARLRLGGAMVKRISKHRAGGVGSSHRPRGPCV